MPPKNIFITGANRGIGLEFVKQLLRLKPKTVIGTCRTRANAKELLEIEKQDAALKVITLDVNAEKSVIEARKQTEEILGSDGLNVLINNAAIYLKCSSIQDISEDAMMQSYRANVVGPALMCREFVPLLKRASAVSGLVGLSWERAAIVNISSDSGSVTENNDVDHYNYGPTKIPLTCLSNKEHLANIQHTCLLYQLFFNYFEQWLDEQQAKAALNMLTKTTSLELKPAGILVVAVHPGWVKTDMTGPEAEITTTESVSGMLKVLPTLGERDSGRLLEYTGRTMPW